MATIGELGEQIVSESLKSQGYEIIHSRWRCRWGEIDIIAQDKASNTLVFVEVKTRSDRNWDEGGLKAISVAKQQKISRTAQLFLATYPHLAEFYCRFDVALVGYHENCAQINLVIKDYVPNAFEILD